MFIISYHHRRLNNNLKMEKKIIKIKMPNINYNKTLPNHNLLLHFDHHRYSIYNCVNKKKRCIFYFIQNY